MSIQDSLKYLEAQLNAEQLAAASYIDGPSLILA